jgi:hypothetical protein
MLKNLFLLVVSVFTLTTNIVFSAPGDTTWVTVFENRKIDHYGNFDTIAQLPTTNVSYRKIRLHYTLGRYACPAGEQYCGSWDYTTMVYAMPPQDDTVEMARIITPYATNWLSSNRKHNYVVEISDYAKILKGQLPIRYTYEGYSWGFTLTLKIEFIEGTPPRTALDFKNVYQGYFPYGNASNSIENYLIPVSNTYNSTAKHRILKNIVSGHGSDDTGCAEFCSKFYNLKVNNQQVSQNQLWKSDCGKNNIYPQTGTWLYDRANWCPGEQVYPILHDITQESQANSTFSVDIDMQSYSAPNQSNASGGFHFATQMIYYGDYHKQLDVSIEDIIAPTKDPNYFRSNGICNTPIIKVKNTGATTVQQLEFSYNLIGGQAVNYLWNGMLAPNEEKVIELEGTSNVFSGNESNEFEVRLLKVNNVQDENSFNDYYKSQFDHVKTYPSKFVVYLKTNNATSNGYNETSWEIKDAVGTIVASRMNATNNTTYTDTVELQSGCYSFTAYDAGCDGISWWAYQYYNPNPGTGLLHFRKADVLGTIKTFNGDFGCEFSERFTVGYTLNTQKEELDEFSFILFPNPAKNVLEIELNSQTFISENEYRIIDLTGKVIDKSKLEKNKQTISIESLNNGVYIFELKTNVGIVTRQFIKE